MSGYNWIDLIIGVLIGLAAYGGFKTGSLKLLFTIGGFFGALLLGGWLFPRIIPFSDRTVLAIVNANLVLLVATYAAFKGYDAGRHFRTSLVSGKLHNLESFAGSLISVAAVLIAIWMITAGLGSLPFSGLSNSANDALIVQKLDRYLPPVPAVFAGLNRLIDPNAPPEIYVKQKPDSSISHAPLPALSPVISEAGNSVVRITSFGCGGIINGSGFVASPGLIATNAHVLAGVKRPIIKYASRSYEAVPVYFDFNQDVAILRVRGLNARPLSITNDAVVSGTQVYIPGYPDGKYAVSGGIVRNRLNLFGSNIYRTGIVEREVYEIQTVVDHGNSGGPALLGDGSVAGMIFAKSELANGYGYALTSASLKSKLASAEDSNKRVSTGACFRD